MFAVRQEAATWGQLEHATAPISQKPDFQEQRKGNFGLKKYAYFPILLFKINLRMRLYRFPILAR